jgi:conjugative transfer pilus assembly protein TraH
MKAFLRKPTVVAMAWALQLTSTNGHAADLTGQMQQMFDQAGAMSNSTGPGAYHSQTMSIYAGGELQMRAPIRNYQIWSVSLPTTPRASCGGIDVWAGSFSHINSSQFKGLLQQIGANTVGLLFKAALKSINPMIESVLGDLEKTIAQYNQYSMNSCQMAQSLVNGVFGSDSASADAACIAQARQINGDDYMAAKATCQNQSVSMNNQAKASEDPEAKALASRDINLVIDALKESSYSREEKELFMNVAGTILLFKAANNGGSPRRAETRDGSVDSLRVLLFGNQPGITPDTVQISGWWTCPTPECMAPAQTTMTITPFPTLVRRKLELLRDLIENKQKLPPHLIGFVNQTSVPVYRMMAVGYLSGSSSRSSYLSDLLIHRYANVIAYDYAHTFLTRALKDVRVHIGLANLQTSAEEKHAAEMRRRVDNMLEQLDRERSDALGRVRDAGAVVDDIQRIEREMRSSLPNSVRNMLDFSNLLTGQGPRM